jgi:hypothetical protein
VPIQPDRARHTSQGVLLADPAVPVMELSMDAPPARDMIAVVRAGERGPLDHAGVEPGGVGHCAGYRDPFIGIGGSNPRVHAEDGSPRSAGLDNAISISSRTAARAP